MSCPYSQENTDIESLQNSLGTDRIVSSIPRNQKDDGSKEHWMYPSPSMFYSAMQRKKWDLDVGDSPNGQIIKEQTMHAVVNLHNVVNEQCWQEIVRWESSAGIKPEALTLVRFRGRPDKTSPKALFRSICGYKKPFDRHDWIVRRESTGQELRYVIDFYAGRNTSNVPASFYLDVRPALDSSSAALMRINGIRSALARSIRDLISSFNQLELD